VQAQARLEMRLARLRRVEHVLSAMRLCTFIAALASLSIGLQRHLDVLESAGWSLCVAFLGLVALHARVVWLHARERQRLRAHERHLARANGSWSAWPSRDVAEDGHPYSFDIDLVGAGSLLSRIDVARTARGRSLLYQWLASAGCDPQTILARQRAVGELSEAVTLRVEAEVAAQTDEQSPLLQAEGFVEFTQRESPLRRWHRFAMWTLPAATGALLLSQWLGLLTGSWWLAPAAVQGGIMITVWSTARRHFDLMDTRRQELEAFARILVLLEAAAFEAPLLRTLQSRLNGSGRTPSRHLRHLSHLAGLAEVRMQVMLHPALNLLMMWDLHVLRALERWNHEAGRFVNDWLWSVAEFEALASLAALYAADSGCTFPTIGPIRDGLRATGLAHPLLPETRRVANDLALVGPGGALIVTGSNMAGKSTLLRSLGLNVALALAGGPVVATAMHLPLVRLRASMRAVDALQRGASYFFAELTKLKMVVQELEQEPPVLFILDELLRGTNARARAVGAAAVVKHLLGAGAMGLVATHDSALCELADGTAGRIANVHLTDVMIDGEMMFDYRLRPGPALTSNALRLLELAGIDPEPSAYSVASARGAQA
jgi:hypothetical protein